MLAAVLAVLQRMGRKPPPALLTQPEDVLRAIRASMMLGAVLPQLRAETEALASDLQDLVSLRAAIAQEQRRLAGRAEARRNERARLDALIAARQKCDRRRRRRRWPPSASAPRRSAGQAASLKDLIARMEGELAGAARRRRRRRERLTRTRARPRGKGGRGGAHSPMSPQRDPARLAPAIAFAQAKGLLSLPAGGTVIKRFGAPANSAAPKKDFRWPPARKPLFRLLAMAISRSAVLGAPTDNS